VQNTAMTELIDRRRSVRVPCDISVDYEVSGALAQLGRITNIGTAGACLTTAGEIPSPVGADLVLRFQFPGSNGPIQAEGKVKWATQGIAGVEFGHLSGPGRDKIARYCAKGPSRTSRYLEVLRELLHVLRRSLRE